MTRACLAASRRTGALGGRCVLPRDTRASRFGIASGESPIDGPRVVTTRWPVAFSKAGLDGITLSWVDYDAGLEHFGRVLLPMLRQAGLRR